MNAEVDIRVQLERMEGTINLTNQKVDTVSANITDLKGEVRKHGDRLGVLEARDSHAAGERAGVSLAAKILWTLGGGSIVAVAAVIARALGA